MAQEESQYKILLIDDEVDLAEVISEYFAMEEIEIKSFTEPLPALEFAQNMPALKLVIIDYGLPGMSGIEFCKALKEKKPGVQFFMMSGLLDQELQEQARQAGVEKIFFKPFDVEELVDSAKELGLPF